MTSKNAKKLIFAIVLILAGILFCFSVKLENTKTVSIVIGACFIAIGLFLILASMMKQKALVTVHGVLGALIISLGVLCISDDVATLLSGYVPVALIGVGVVFIVDGLLKIAYKQYKNKAELIVIFLFGALLLAGGLCLRFIESIQKYTNLLFGIAMILYGVWLVAQMILEKRAQRREEKQRKREEKRERRNARKAARQTEIPQDVEEEQKAPEQEGAPEKREETGEEEPAAE